MQTMGLQHSVQRMDGCMGYSPIDSKRGFAQVAATNSINWRVCQFGATNFFRSREIETRAIFFSFAKDSHCKGDPFELPIQTHRMLGEQGNLCYLKKDWLDID